MRYWPSRFPAEATISLISEDLDIRHPAQAATSLMLLLLGGFKARRALILHMRAQQAQDLRVCPARGYRSVSRLERANGLRPLATLGTGVHPSLRDGVFLGRLCALRELGGMVLRRPVIDIPVVLIEEAIIFLQLGVRHFA